MNDHLFLHEELLLLALCDQKGTIHSNTDYNYAIAGGIMAELLLHNRIELSSSKKKQVRITDATPLGNRLVDDVLGKIRVSKRQKTLQTWIQKCAQTGKIKHKVAEPLVQQGLLRMEQDKVMGLFPRKRYPTVNRQPEQGIIQRIRQAVLNDSDDLEPRTVLLISLAKSTNLLKTCLDKREIKQHKDRIKKIINGEFVGSATTEAIQAMQAAAAAVAVTTVAASAGNR